MSHIDEGALHAYLDGEVSEREREEIAAHLSACDERRPRLDEAAALRGTASELVAELEPGSVQTPAWREIEERATARQRGTPGRRLVRPSLAWAASIVIAFGIGWLARSSYLEAPASFRQPIAQGIPETAQPVTTEPVSDLDAVDAQPPSVEGAVDERLEEAEGAQRSVARAKSQPEPTAADPTAAGRAAEQVAAPVEADRERQLAADARRDQAAQAPPPGEAADRLVADTALLQARGAVAEEVALEDEAPGEARAAALRANFEAAAEANETRFFAVQPEEATVWLGAQLRTLPDLGLKRVEVGPGGRVAAGLSGLPAVRLVYEDAAGHEIVLIQQWIGPDAAAALPSTLIEPSGRNTYRWDDGRGYRLTLIGAVAADSLRALAARIR